MRVIDLEPHEYRSTVKGPAPERDKREPFWGPIARAYDGAPPAPLTEV